MAQMLLREIEEAAETMGMAPATLCKHAAKHGALYGRLLRGGAVRSDVVDKIRAYIAANRPAGAAHESERASS
jgi:hypothetical protein